MSQKLSKMREASRRNLMRLALGFFFVTLAMAVVIFFAQASIKSVHQDLERFIEDENAEVELIQNIRYVVSERMLLMHQIALEGDAFRRDELIQKFYGLAGGFIKARDRLEKMASSTEERAQLAELRRLTKLATPFHEHVVELLGQSQIQQARQFLQEKSLPAQQKVMDQTTRLLDFHKAEADVEIKESNTRYQRDSFILVILGSLAASLSWIISVKVLDSAWKGRLALVGEIERREEAQQQLVLARDSLETQVRQRTADLQSTAAQLEEAQRIAHIGYFDWRLKEGCLYWSDEIYSMFDLPKSGGASREKLMQIVHPDDLAYVQRSVDMALHEGASIDITHRILRPDATIRIVHLQGEVSYDSDGKPASMLGTIQDVTENKEIEQKLRLSASVFANSGEGIIIADANKVIVDVNDAFTQITGYQREEVVGQPLRMLQSGQHDPSFYRAMQHQLEEQGQWQGEMWAKHKTGDVFPKWQTINVIRDETGKLVNYIAIFRDISEIKQHEEQLWKLAHFDNLCGVANRSLMYANLRMAMSTAQRDGTQVAMLLFDLDRFKQVNDTLGHDVGDQLLVHVAQQLKDSVRECDTVARFGGDEFAVILANAGEKKDVANVVEKIQKALETPLTIKGGEVIAVNASIGIALYPSDVQDIDGLMKAADQAMYRAKVLGRNNYQFYAETMLAETANAIG